jgi:hypothetical protein
MPTNNPTLIVEAVTALIYIIGLVILGFHQNGKINALKEQVSAQQG